MLEKIDVRKKLQKLILGDFLEMIQDRIWHTMFGKLKDFSSL